MLFKIERKASGRNCMYWKSDLKGFTSNIGIIFYSDNNVRLLTMDLLGLRIYFGNKNGLKKFGKGIRENDFRDI